MSEVSRKPGVEEYVENFLVENAALRRKLQSKSEALLIISKELDSCRTERDQFKLMAEQLQDRYSTLKKKTHEMGFSKLALYYDGMDSYPTSSQSIIQVLGETKEQNKALKMEIEDLKQKLRDAQGDIKVLRAHLNRQSISCTNTENQNFPSHQREELLQQLETMNEKCSQLRIDLQSILDEKEDLVTERDAYKCKVHRLNHELNSLLKGDSNKVVDVDALVMENRYLQDRLQQAEEEKDLSNQALVKYKGMLDKKRSKGTVKLGTNNTGMVMSHKQVHQLLEKGSASQLPNTAATLADMKSLCLALLDALGDKSLALSHQKKANKILANRITELEQRLEVVQGGKVAVFPSQWLLEGYMSSEVDKDMQHILDEFESKNGCSNGIDTPNGHLDTCNGTSNTDTHSELESENFNKPIPTEPKPKIKIKRLSSEGSVLNSESNAESNHFESRLPPQLQQLVQKALDDIKQETRH